MRLISVLLLSILPLCMMAQNKPASQNDTPTRVMFWLDTEDYTSDRSNDAIVGIARTLEAEGVKGHFVVVGQCCKFFMENKRYDVIEALRHHIVGTQSLYHSFHPNITEMSDLEDYDEAYARVLAEESECAGMIKAVLGVDSLTVSDWPGDGASYVADDVMADMGVIFHGDSGVFEGASDAVWYQNRLHIPYWSPFGLDNLNPRYGSKYDLDKELDRLAEQKLVCLYSHPHMAVRQEHWDIPHFNKGNLVKFGEWLPATPVPQSETDEYYRRLGALVRRIKADPRFEISDVEQLRSELKPRKEITLNDIPAIRSALTADFGPVSVPASWSVADCFQAVVHLLNGEKSYAPDKVYGFLDAPAGVSKPVTLRAKDIRKAAAEIDISRHLPASIRVGRKTIGPADFLFAALEVLQTGARKVRVEPREQLGDIAAKLPALATFRQDGWTTYSPEFKDDYLSDRLRLQFWTLRYEY